MKVALIYNESKIDPNDVINVFGMSIKEHHSPKAVERVARVLEERGHAVKVIEGDIHLVEELKEFMPKVVAGENHGMVFNMAYGIQGHNYCSTKEFILHDSIVKRSALLASVIYRCTVKPGTKV